MTSNQKQQLYCFGQIEGVGLKKQQLLYEHFGSVSRVLQASLSELFSIKGITKKDAEAIFFAKQHYYNKKEWKKLQVDGISYVSYFDEEYPEVLRHLYQPPKHLFVKGELPSESAVAIGIVGARDCSYYGRDMARMFGFRLAKAGVSVISGMAKGVDGWAHQGALESGGKTYAVLGCGVEVCYPSAHQRLYQSIWQRGGLISEFSPYTQAKPNFFPMRNRIISGLSKGILVVEAREKSGSLITADAALDQGKDVFVIPGRIGDVLSVGCNRLIRQGAIPVVTPNDILEYYDLDTNNIEERLINEEKIIIEILTEKPMHIDEIKGLTKLDETAVFKGVLHLKKEGRIREVSRGYFMRNFN